MAAYDNVHHLEAEQAPKCYSNLTYIAETWAKALTNECNSKFTNCVLAELANHKLGKADMLGRSACLQPAYNLPFVCRIKLRRLLTETLFSLLKDSSLLCRHAWCTHFS
jgi:hypothetical protein